MAWGTGEKIGLATLLLTLVGVIAAIIVVPEVRTFFRLESSPEQQQQVSQKPPQQPNSESLSSSHGSGLVRPAKVEGRWVDTKEDEFYTFLPNGKVEYRLHPFESPHPWSAQMSWYQLGSEFHFKKIASYSRDCEGIITPDIISCKCSGPLISEEMSHLELHRLPEPPVKKPPVPKPRAVDGVWLEPQLTVRNLPLFISFQPDGKLLSHIGSPTGLAVHKGDTWYESDGNIHVTYVVSDGVLECTGRPDGDLIIGKCKTVNTGAESDWRMERATKR